MGKTVTSRSLQYSPEYIDTLEKLKATDVISMGGHAVPLGEVADVAVRKMPERVRNENGELTGYIWRS